MVDLGTPQQSAIEGPIARVVDVKDHPPEDQTDASLTAFGHSRIPAEVWLHVFHIVQLMDEPERRRTLKSITLTHRSWRALAQPLLFTAVQFRQLAIIMHDTGSTVLAQHRDTLKRLEARMDFVLSDRIAPSVRSIRCILTGVVRHESTLVTVDLFQLLIAKIPHIRLHGLKSMSFPMHCLNVEDLHALQALRSLEYLSIQISKQNTQSLLPAPRNLYLKQLVLSGPLVPLAFPGPLEEDTGCVYWWTPLLSPETLEELWILDDPEMTESWMATVVSREMVFLRLRQLRLKAGATHSPKFIGMLELCPALEVLQLDKQYQSRGVEEAAKGHTFPTGAVTKLHTVDAPLTVVLSFARQRSLRSAMIQGIMTSGQAAAVITELVELLPHLQHLDITVRDVSAELTLMCLTKFRELQGFRCCAINRRNDDRFIEDIAGSLDTVDFTPTLRVVHMDCKFDGVEHNQVPPKDISAQYQASLEKRFPDLVQFRLCGMNVLLQWGPDIRVPGWSQLDGY